MGPLHEVEHFVEAIVNPNAVVERGTSYDAPDGSSKMPYNDSLTVQELIALVAYMQALRPPGTSPGRSGGSVPRGQDGHASH